MTPEQVADNFFYIGPDEKIKAVLADGTEVIVSNLGGKVEFFGENGELMQTGDGAKYHFKAGTFIEKE